ncbi:MAG TPA: ATP-binding protein [Solirubrobacteraceae bacterium]|jgi:K+-sensing histidine kinase KdpD|nr:ATP-binding protein [Solirubrobacteraceae bacterium]
MSRLLGFIPVPTSRARREALERRREASLVMEMARLLLRGGTLAEVLPTAAARVAQALELQSAAIVMEAVEPDGRSVAFPLREGDRRLGTVVVAADSSERSLYRLQERVVPALEALLSAALERETLQGGVVETAVLRQADVVKTALLRAVSHDLRSPLTAISTAGEAIALPGVSALEREELAGVILGETRRLSRLVDNLLDLSKLQTGAAEPRREWLSVEEIIRMALEDLAPPPTPASADLIPLPTRGAPALGGAPSSTKEASLSGEGVSPSTKGAPSPGEGAPSPTEGASWPVEGAPSPVEGELLPAGEEFHLSIDRDLPLVRADSTQLERALVNVLENARRHSGGHPVSVRARAVRTLAGEGDRLIVRVVDRGPGIPPAQLERVFEPFYRAGTARGGRRGSGLGLAIARGFVEANGGTLHVESLPGQGATFVFELPLERSGPSPATRPARDGPAPAVQPPSDGPAPAPSVAHGAQGRVDEH